MKKSMLLLAVLAAGLLFSSCASFEIVKGQQLNKQELANSDTTIAHINAQNWGIYVLWFPLVSGSTDEAGKIAFLKDTVNAECMMNAMTKEAKKLNGTAVYDVASQYVYGGFLLRFPSINMSGNIVK